MPVRFLRNASELADVSMESPLPVQVANAKPVPADTFLIATTTITTDANRDLLGSTSTELPTLDNCGQYRKLVWFYFRTGNAPTTYRILARATDIAGTPLGAGWQEIVATTPLPGDANSWNRIEIPSFGEDGYYDQYRIEVWRTNNNENNYTLASKVIGVR
jgi:hypothetical protein